MGSTSQKGSETGTEKNGEEVIKRKHKTAEVSGVTENSEKKNKKMKTPEDLAWSTAAEELQQSQQNNKQDRLQRR
jgi:hypothetical protein